VDGLHAWNQGRRVVKPKEKPPKKGSKKRLEKTAFSARQGVLHYSPRNGPFLEKQGYTNPVDRCLHLSAGTLKEIIYTK
jgi:hypothetical protein